MLKLVGTMIVMFLFALFVIVPLSLISAVPVWLLWNWAVVAVFHAPVIAFLHVWGLLLLLAIFLNLIRSKVKATHD